MGGAHRHLLVHEEGPLHRLAPQCKVAATVLFVFAVVATPREQFWAFGVQAALIAAAALIGRVPLTAVARRLVIEIPFVAFAVLLPVVGRPRVDVLWFSLSEPGLWAGWNIVVKGTLGVAATVVLASTTSIPQLLDGLERLRVPTCDGRHHRVHDPVRRRPRRRGAANGHRPAVPGRGVDESARCVRSPRRPGRCSCGRTSGESGSTWRWSRGGYAGTMPVRSTAASAPGAGVCLLWPGDRRDRRRDRMEHPMIAGRRWSSATSSLTATRGRSPRVARHRLHRRARRTGGRARSERRRQDDPRARRSSGILTPQHGALAVSGSARRKEQPAGDPASRRHRVPGYRTTSCSMPTVREDVAVRPGQPRLAADRARSVRGDRARHRRDERGGPLDPHHLSFGERRRVWRWRRVLAMQPDVLVLDEPVIEPRSRGQARAGGDRRGKAPTSPSSSSPTTCPTAWSCAIGQSFSTRVG